MSELLRTIETFHQPTDAYIAIACGKLEAEGIDAFMFDYYMVSVNWLYSYAVGGVKLKVEEPNVPRAMEILKEDLSAIPDVHEAMPAGPALQCPRCSSSEVSAESFSRRESFTRRLIFLSWLLLGIPLPFFRRRWVCEICGYRWKRR